MASAWIIHVKKFAAEHKMKFGEALADKRCSASYKSNPSASKAKVSSSKKPKSASKNRSKSRSKSKRSRNRSKSRN